MIMMENALLQSAAASPHRHAKILQVLLKKYTHLQKAGKAPQRPALP